MGVFVVHVPSAAGLTEARPKAKTNTTEIAFFIVLPFQSLSLQSRELLIFSHRALRAASAALLCSETILPIEGHLDSLLQKAPYVQIPKPPTIIHKST
jgi:hypothetical protein